MEKDFIEQIENLEDLIGFQEKKLDEDCLICECFCVNVRDIRERCETQVDFDLLAREFSLGLGCQSCLKNKNAWVDRIF